MSFIYFKTSSGTEWDVPTQPDAPPPSTQHRSLATSPPFSSKKSVSSIPTWDHLNHDCSILGSSRLWLSILGSYRLWLLQKRGSLICKWRHQKRLISVIFQKCASKSMFLKKCISYDETKLRERIVCLIVAGLHCVTARPKKGGGWHLGALNPIYWRDPNTRSTPINAS